MPNHQHPFGWAEQSFTKREGKPSLPSQPPTEAVSPRTQPSMKRCQIEDLEIAHRLKFSKKDTMEDVSGSNYSVSFSFIKLSNAYGNSSAVAALWQSFSDIFSERYNFYLQLLQIFMFVKHHFRLLFPLTCLWKGRMLIFPLWSQCHSKNWDRQRCELQAQLPFSSFKIIEDKEIQNFWVLLNALILLRWDRATHEGHWQMSFIGIICKSHT